MPALLAIVIVTACQKAPAAPLVATSIEITSPIPGMRMSAAYLTLTNNTHTPIRISKITSEEYESVQMHDTIIENGIAKMRRIKELTVPPDSTVSLERGGKHLMLMQADTMTSAVSLHFHSDSTLLLSVQTTVTKRND
jgi:copper(I)-binding protein